MVTMSISITVKMEKTSKLSAFILKSITEALERSAIRIKKELQYLSPVDKGGLRGSFQANVYGTGIRISWDAPYAKYVDAGTPPHIIRPRSKKALSFRGQVYKMVKHPGQAPQNFSTLTGLAAIEIIKQELPTALSANLNMVI